MLKKENFVAGDYWVVGTSVAYLGCNSSCVVIQMGSSQKAYTHYNDVNTVVVVAVIFLLGHLPYRLIY